MNSAVLTQLAPPGAETTLVGGVPRITGEFWTARQRQAMRLHEVSYRACFKPQLPAFFIERLTKPGDAVYDPFMGRGTTPIEAARLGRTPLGNDINPLSRLLCAPRLNTPALPDIQKRLAEIPWDDFQDFEREDLLAFYHPRTLAAIEGLRRWLLERKAQGILDGVDAWIRMVAINRLTGHSAGFFSVYTLPPNQAVSVESQKKINARRAQTPPLRDVPALILKKSRALLADGAIHAPQARLFTRPADNTPDIESGCVALTVTSPPFLDVVQYAADNWLRCWFAGLDAEQLAITQSRSPAAWQAFTHRVLAELARLTRAGGHIAYEVGEVRRGTLRLEETVLAAAAGLPLQPLAVLINRQHFTKTAHCWGVANNQGGTNSNRIVLMRREHDQGISSLPAGKAGVQLELF